MKCNLSVVSFLLCMLFPAVLLATPDMSTSGTAKGAWLDQVKAGVSVPVCKSFVEDESISTQMKARDINYEKCLTLLPVIANQCIQKYNAQMPETLNDDMAEKWGHIIGECIGNDFAVSYLYSDMNNPRDNQKTGS